MGNNTRNFRNWYQNKGELYIHQKAILCGCANPVQCSLCDRSGHIYENQYRITVDGQQYTDYGHFHDAADGVESQEFGIITGGTLMAKTFREDAILYRPDRVLLPKRPALVARETMTRGEDDIDGLLYPFMHRIAYIRQGAVVFDSSEWTECETGAQWLTDNRPEVGTSYAIEYTYAPIYEATGENTRSPRPGNGGLMPQRSILRRWVPDRPGQTGETNG